MQANVLLNRGQTVNVAGIGSMTVADIADRVELFHHCISPTRGVQTMSGPKPLGSSISHVHGSTDHTLLRAANGSIEYSRGELQWSVSCSPLQHVLSTLHVPVRAEHVALIKMDVEGAETSIVPSLLEWLRDAAPRPSLLVELHPPFWGLSAQLHVDVTQRLLRVFALYRHVFLKPRTRSDEASVNMTPLDVPALLARTDPLILCDTFCTVFCTDAGVAFRPA
jgi:hypothetical protein